MSKRNRTQLVLGVLLILVAGWLILDKLAPPLTQWLNLAFDWPIWILIAGAILFLMGLATGNTEMAVPACVVAGIGGILYYQNQSGDWASWSYMWALLPALGGVGNLLSALLNGTLKQEGRHAINTIFFSSILFLIFASFFGGLKIFGAYKDYAIAGIIFLVGLWLILRGIFRKQ